MSSLRTLMASMLLIATLTAVAPPAAAHHCAGEQDIPANGSATALMGPPGPGTSAQFNYHHQARDSVSYRVVPAANMDVDLQVYAGDCFATPRLCESNQGGRGAVETCQWSGVGSNFFVIVANMDPFSGTGTFTLEYSGGLLPGTPCGNGIDDDWDGMVDYPNDAGCDDYMDTDEQNPACNDGLDNDGDGNTDWPADSGCSGPQDTSEGCAGELVSGVVVCIEPVAVIAHLGVSGPVLPPGSNVRVAGYVDLYQFRALGVTTTLACVTLETGIGGNSQTVDACAALGGTQTARLATLIDQTIPAPGVPGIQGEILGVDVCSAELTATVFGAGVNSAPAYTVC